MAFTAEKIIYKSPRMAELINLAGRVAASKASILIQGESWNRKGVIGAADSPIEPPGA